MSEVVLHRADGVVDEFRHEAFLYAGITAFLHGTLPFIQAGLDADEPVLVVVSADKIEQLRDGLGPDAHRVTFLDMAEAGRNPARIIPAWRDFLAQHGGRRPLRGIGEPVWAERTADELVECQRHESLLNVAFAGGGPWRLLCPYDTSTLTPEVIGEARHSHRFLTDGQQPVESADYLGDEWTGVDDLLPEPPVPPVELTFGPGPLDPLRQFVAEQVGDDLGPPVLSDLLVALTEVVSNSLIHGGAAGTLRTWRAPGAVICEVRDRGWIRQPLVGRARPNLLREGGRGLWMVNQLCDLVQLRSSPAGTVVRLHMALPA